MKPFGLNSEGISWLTERCSPPYKIGSVSGLYDDDQAENGSLKFLAVPDDRGLNGDADGNNRPFLLPDYQARVVTFGATSEGIFVTAEGSPIVSIGDQARVFGTVSEVIQGNVEQGNLSVT